MCQNIIQELGDRLVLRRASKADAKGLMDFHGDIHREVGVEEPEEYVRAWVQDLLSGNHPTFSPSDFTLVEDKRTGEIVSSLCTISQTWSYDGVKFGVGQPELVGTHPAYRNQGLVRAQFEVIHEWSAERGEMVQAITGIPWFYRQFGYEMSMTLGGARLGYKPQVPKLGDGKDEPYHIRPAAETDLPFIAEVYEHGTKRYPMACVRNEALWRYELKGKSEKNDSCRAISLIETVGRKPVGFIAHSTRLRRSRVGVGTYELKPGVSWLAVTPSVVRYLWALGEEWSRADPKQEMECFAFWLGANHPAYQALRDQLPHEVKPYAWYLRVADLVGFLRHVAPALKQRLVDSPLVGHSGELHLSFYRRGVRLAFEDGLLTEVKPWQPTVEKGGDAAFPDFTFLQLLFGYRSLEELKYAFADCWTANDEARALLEALFPKKASNVWPVS